MHEPQKDTVSIGPELIGYTDRFSVAPGERVKFMVSAEIASARAQLVQLVHGDERSPIGLVEREMTSSVDGVWPLERQVVYPGSFGLIEPSDIVVTAASLQLSGHLFLMPTLVESARPQGVLAQVHADGRGAWELVVEEGGDLVARIFDDAGTDTCVRLAGVLRNRSWYSVCFSFDRTLRQVHLWCTALEGLAAGETLHAEGQIQGLAPTGNQGALLLAARRLIAGKGEPRAAETFNGKLERPILFVGNADADAAAQLAEGILPVKISSAVLLDLDLGAQPDGWQLCDRSPFNQVARVYNAPLRNCTSHNWSGNTLTPALAPAEYAAIHFHDDDVHHANWSPTHEWLVPADQPSGLYALRLRGDGVEDRIPFIVRPPRDRATQAVALWLPSFSYAAYANTKKALLGTPHGEFRPEPSSGDALLDRHPEWGGSAYDFHSDGSGVMISTLARPVPNLRPTHRVGLVNAPRHLAADLYLIHWLEHMRVPFDVIGDEDVHAEGYALLQRYATVITGGHPEYVTDRELSAVEEYTNDGGRLMYLGGNGFYWVTSIAPETSTTIEIRRGHAGTRIWSSAPGELYHQFTGEHGGLWRHRGRPPHALTGIGFVSEGWDGRNRPYLRRPDSFKSEASWAFEGIGSDEPIGEGGLIMGGGAGDELDSANEDLGTPAQTLILASSSGHSDAYWLVIEDMMEGRQGVNGTQDPRIRADVTLTPKREAGAVFAVGSISWSGSLSHQGYDNPLARLSENVLRAFASGSSPWLRGADGADSGGA